MNQRVRAWIIWPLVGLQILLIVLVAVLDTLSLPTSAMANQSLAGIWSFAFAVVMNLNFGLVMDLVVGALIFWRRPEHPIGWLFCLEDIGWTINNFARAYVTYALVAHSGALPAPDLIIWFYDWPVFISVGLFIFLIMLFPTGRLASPRWRLLAWFVVAWIAVGTVGAAFAPGPVNPIQGISMDNPAGVAGPVGQLLAQCYNFALLLPAPLTLLAAASMLLRQRRAQGQERQQLKWFTSAIVVVVICYSVESIVLEYYDTQAAMPLWVYVVYSITMSSGMLIPVAVGIAILRYRLFDIDVIIRRTLVYALLTFTLGLVYLGCIVVSRPLVTPYLGGSELAIVVSTLAIAALFLPLRRRVQNLIDKRFYRRKYDAAKVLAAFGVTARDETDLERLTGEMLRIVDETMQPEFVGLWLREPNNEVKH